MAKARKPTPAGNDCVVPIRHFSPSGTPLEPSLKPEDRPRHPSGKSDLFFPEDYNPPDADEEDPTEDTDSAKDPDVSAHR